MTQGFSLRRAQDQKLWLELLRGRLYLGRKHGLNAALEAKIAALTLDDVNGAIRKYVKPELMNTTTLVILPELQKTAK